MPFRSYIRDAGRATFWTMLDSIRLRLTLWYAGVLALLVIIFAVLTFFFVQRILSQEVDSSLFGMSQTFTSAVNSEVSAENEKITSNEAITELSKEFKFQDFQLSVFSNDGKLIAKTFEDDFPTDFSFTSYATFQFNNQSFRVFATPLKIAGSEYKLLIYHNLTEENQITSKLAVAFLLIVPLILVPALLLGYWLAKRSLKPVSEMSRQAKNISANNLNARLVVNNERDEIGELTNVINELLNRLEQSFEQQKRFMADASHELRTPLAIVQGESEVALSQKNRAVSDLRESLAVVLDESKRLTKIVEDLFTLSRVDAGVFKTNFKRIYLDEILADCVRNVRVLADKKKIALDIATEETEISGDEQLLHRLFLNLLDNAVKYNRECGEVRVNLANKRVTISDTGLGIAAQDQPKIFERFYRTDKSRNRAAESSTSGAGLGLAIAKWIAELHQADLNLSQSSASGSEFTIKFPVEK